MVLLGLQYTLVIHASLAESSSFLLILISAHGDRVHDINEVLCIQHTAYFHLSPFDKTKERGYDTKRFVQQA